MIRPTNIIKADPIETERSAHWTEDAACLIQNGVEPETFFPTSDAQWIADAKAICATCPVIAQCLEKAMNPATREHYGVWGGMTADERAALIKKRDRERDALRKKQAREQRKRAS